MAGNKWLHAAYRRGPRRIDPGCRFAICLYTTQRISDVVGMGWQHVKGNRIAVRQIKTDTPLLIPMHPEVLKTVPKINMTFLSL